MWCLTGILLCTNLQDGAWARAGIWILGFHCFLPGEPASISLEWSLGISTLLAGYTGLGRVGVRLGVETVTVSASVSYSSHSSIAHDWFSVAGSWDAQPKTFGSIPEDTRGPLGVVMTKCISWYSSASLGGKRSSSWNIRCVLNCESVDRKHYSQ